LNSFLQIANNYAPVIWTGFGNLRKFQSYKRILYLRNWRYHSV
jgi:hypothetical protein